MMGTAVTLIIVAMLLAMLVLPAGAELTWVGGEKKWMMIIWGIRLPIPYKLLERISWLFRKLFRKAKKEVKSGRLQSRLMQWLKAASHDPGTSPYELELKDLQEGYQFLRKLMKYVHVRVHRFQAIVATPDPALTGMVYGWAWAARAWLPAQWPISLEVDFARERPEVGFRVEFSAVPVKLIGFGLHIFWLGLRRRLSRSKHYS